MTALPHHPLRAIIIDDEPGCVANLRQQTLLCCPGLTVVGTATTLEAAQRLLLRENFDIVFLDIQMAQQTSLDVLGPSPARPYALIFVTAYEQYALRAFGFGAVDYLVKPLHEPDLVRAYRKARQSLGVLERSDSTTPAPAPTPSQKLILPQGEQVYVVPAEEVLRPVAGAGRSVAGTVARWQPVARS